jgi:AraC family transcriptional regulator
VASSSRWAWAGLFQDDQFAPFLADELIALPNDHIVIASTSMPSRYMRESRRGRTFEGPTFAGGLSVIIPNGEPTQWQGTFPAHLRLAVPPSLVSKAAADIYGTRTSQLSVTDVLLTTDPTLARLAELVVAELHAPDHPAQQLMFDSLASAIAAHMLRGYTGLDEPRTTPPALTPRGVRLAIDYIHRNPTAAPGLAELAATVGYSDQAHFTRRFRAHTGTTPGQYRSRTVLGHDSAARIKREQLLAKPSRNVLYGTGLTAYSR